MIAIAKPELVNRIIFLDVLGPKEDFSTQRRDFLHHDIERWLSEQEKDRKSYPDQESAIQERMKGGKISHQAAQALVARGTIKNPYGRQWTFDERLRCVASTLPHEDELLWMFSSIAAPGCLILANNGLRYSKAVFENRAQAIRDLTIVEIDGGHHVHMDNPMAVASEIARFLGEKN
jgi:hypothetical protein